MRVSKIQNNSQRIRFKAVSPKFQPPRTVIKNKVKDFSQNALNLLEYAVEFCQALIYLLRVPLMFLVGYIAIFGGIGALWKADCRTDLKEKMNNTIVLEESDGGKTITEAEKIDFYDAVDYYNENIYGLNTPFKIREVLDTQYDCNEFIKSATELNSDGGIKITDKEKQEFELIKIQKKQERAEKKALKKNRLK